MKRLIKKADEDHFNTTTDYVDSPSGIVFNTGWDAIEIGRASCRERV